MNTTAQFSEKSIAQAQFWIAQSVRTGQIIHITAATDDEEAELSAQSEDSAEDATHVEYWGTTDEGHDWRVHIDAPRN